MIARFFGRIWARIRLFFFHPLVPPPLAPRPPASIEDLIEQRGGPSPVLEAHESTHVVGMRNPKMTGRTSATHKPPNGTLLRQRPDRKVTVAASPTDLQTSMEVRPGELMECLDCGAWFPPEDIASHDCDDAFDSTTERVAGGGSSTFSNANDNVRYLGAARRKADS